MSREFCQDVPDPLGVFKKFVQKQFVRMLRSLKEGEKWPKNGKMASFDPFRGPFFPSFRPFSPLICLVGPKSILESAFLCVRCRGCLTGGNERRGIPHPSERCNVFQQWRCDTQTRPSRDCDITLLCYKGRSKVCATT